MDQSTGLDGGVFRPADAAWTNPPLDSLMRAPSRAGNAGMVRLVSLGGIAVLDKKTGRRIAFAGLVALAAAVSYSRPHVGVRRPSGVAADVLGMAGG